MSYAILELKMTLGDRIRAFAYEYLRKPGSNDRPVKVYACLKYADDTIPCFETRVCARCSFLRADSLMLIKLNQVVAYYKKIRKNPNSLIAGQKHWMNRRNSLANKVSKEYKGGTMEMTIFSESLTEQTNKRSKYLEELVRQ